MTKKHNENILLVAVDFTVFSEQALLFASNLAEKLKATLLILHVIHDPAETPGFYAQKGKKKKFIRTMEDSANDMMQEFLEKMRKTHPKQEAIKNAVSLLVVGTPVTRIIEIARKKQAYMIVMGSHGRTGLSHLLVGSKV